MNPQNTTKNIATSHKSVLLDSLAMHISTSAAKRREYIFLFLLKESHRIISFHGVWMSAERSEAQ